MFILWLIIVGIVIGVLARLLLPGRDPIGFVGTILVGIVGAVVGGLLWDAIFPNNDNRGVAVIPGIIVAMALLWIYRKVTAGRNASSV
ncbi:MAG: hypothetical protein QOH90_1810 [Actinomycetota bacterium]|jgi:uncharacterized membrane protein YeaQ/YmgE (transglycosylase-associated protein family)|nr:hypothetical protein [Actinomycetota bacterium]